MLLKDGGDSAAQQPTLKSDKKSDTSKQIFSKVV